jgi:hypothetical protein
MRRYEPLTPRLALAFAALAMTAITLGLSVVLPAQMDAYGDDNWAASGMVATAVAGVVGGIEDDDVDAGKPAPTAVSCPVLKAEHAPKT